MPKSLRQKRLEQFESLEKRQLLAANVFRGTVWNIAGTEQSDKIVIELDAKHAGYLIARNGNQLISRAIASIVRRIRVNGLGGDDQIVVKSIDMLLPSNPKSYKIAVAGGDGNDLVLGESNKIYVDGGAGNDSIFGTPGNDTLVGNAGDDSIYGDYGRDSIFGDDGNDSLYGAQEADTIIAGTGRDDVEGGQGRDWMDGSAGRDSLYGGTERDTLIGGKQPDLLERDNKNDLIEPQANDTVVAASPTTNWRAETQAFARNGYGSATAGGDGIFLWTSGGYIRSASLADTASASSHSTTNVQVSGIDEADTLENDGNYIYSIDRSGVVITDIRDPANMQVVSNTTFDGTLNGLYLDGNKLTVVWTKYDKNNSTSGLYYWRYWGGDQKTVVTTFDVTDRSHPVQTTETAIDGMYQTSRYTDGKVYLLTQYYEQIPQIEGEYIEGIFVPESQASYQARLAAAAAINGAKYTVASGMQTITGGLGDTAQRVDVSLEPASSQTSYVTLIDVATPGSAPVDSISMDQSGYYSAIYMSPSAIYMAENGYEKSRVIKVGIAPDHLSYEGYGNIDGYIQNQFSMDESSDGTLKVTSQVDWGRTATTNFTILKDTGDTLHAIGKLTGLAPGETLYATRYIGDRAYFITYGPDWSKVRFYDPLFVVDTSDPSDPKSLGELKLPGYSSYLHPIDETHLIGLGVRDDDANGLPEGLELSLFDVTDPAKPKRTDVYKFSNFTANDWSYSSAQWDHLAFTYVPETGMLAVPFDSWGYDNGNPNNYHSTHGIEVVKVDLNSGIDFVNRVETDGDQWYSLRGALAADSVFAISDSKISSTKLTDSNITGSVDLPDNPSKYPSIYWLE